MEPLEPYELALGYLNSLLKADPEAMDALFHYRVSCNGQMETHTTCPVRWGVRKEIPAGTYSEANARWGVPKEFTVSILGVLVGLAGCLGAPGICLEVESECPVCHIKGDDLEAAGWKSGDAYCPCGELLIWHPHKFAMKEVEGTQ